ncbi:AraC family transcriptional regulator [Stigmatella sp. ncwal1]|uniref:AraC family transcriptional regulator n=1 Tax=Stigmatella ashevillensis TaxID=2995309 RepID=A0ABT5DB70_9BACT|nr:AraC family transcriptional regulator [Stigmatella ashevillena]MDC0710304.1 AraC family transcriptional regulator [Stigmatella ashevillena]
MPANLPKRTNDEGFHESLQRLTEYALRLVPPSTVRTAQLVTPRHGLYLLRQHQRTAFEAAIYAPTLCLILQGCKEMTFGEHHFRLRVGECALVSHDLPIVSRVRDAPYLVLLLNIEVDVLRSLYEDIGELVTAAAEARALEVHQADSRLLDAIGRYLTLAESETDARVLRPMLLKEIHYRLMMAPLGHMLRSLIRHDSHASSIARAIALLRRDFRSPMVVEELARAVGMSVSSFHKHFKAVTLSSPLQYQKGLRLLEARRMLVVGKASVTTVAFEVGYESPSQFSREYTRKFGRPPSQDVAPKALSAPSRFT